ncbi:hypothetical protein D5086_025301 [Populus alba]|uniref:Uncharacterized protein n=1 Tax=Populus alba TaxID=43335 RepID=A0ACC4AZ73_POPAL
MEFVLPWKWLQLGSRVEMQYECAQSELFVEVVGLGTELGAFVLGCFLEGEGGRLDRDGDGFGNDKGTFVHGDGLMQNSAIKEKVLVEWLGRRDRLLDLVTTNCSEFVLPWKWLQLGSRVEMQYECAQSELFVEVVGLGTELGAFVLGCFLEGEGGRLDRDGDGFGNDKGTFVHGDGLMQNSAIKEKVLVEWLGRRDRLLDLVTTNCSVRSEG